MAYVGKQLIDTEMSKLQGRETSAFSDIANTTLADQVESRLKELERNIAVARQFIKLADECSSQVRHEWDLLQQDIRTAPIETSSQLTLAEHPRKHEITPHLEGFPTTKKKTKHQTGEDEFKEETEDTSTALTETDTTPTRTKHHGSTKKEAGPTNETKTTTITSKNSYLAKPRHKK